MKVLLFDDDKSTVDMLRQVVPWERYGIDCFAEAYHIDSAKAQLMDATDVQLMILDIEAKGGTGLELLAWARENHVDAPCIFLTSHAEFAYAQQAIALGAVAFVLKLSPLPVLEEAIGRAMQQAESQAHIQRLTYYRSYYENHHQTMRALFWKRLISDRYEREDVARLAREMEMDVPLERRYILCGFAFYPQAMEESSFAPIRQELRKQMGLALKRCDEQSEVVFEEGERYLLWGVTDERCHPAVLPAMEEYAATMRRRYPGVTGNGVVGEPWLCEQLFQRRVEIRAMLMNMMNPACPVQPYRPPEPSPAEAPLSMKGWQEYLLTNRKAELFEIIQTELDSAAQHDQMNLPMLKSFFTDYMQFLFATLEQYGLSASDVLGEAADMQEKALRSVFDMKKWVSLSLDRAAAAISEATASRTVLDDVYAYIRENCCTELSRGQIASHFFLHEDYLSRIFNRRYGMSIPQCITCLRIERAKVLLSAGQSISDTAGAVGYDNFSYFSKAFRKVTGTSPAAYRQQCVNRSEKGKK